MDANNVADLILYGFWALTPKNATRFRDNKRVGGGDKVPVFVPSRSTEPEFFNQPKPDGHISVYQRTASKGLKEEKDPPPRNEEEAIDWEWAKDPEKSKYRYLEQHEMNHPEISLSSFIDKDGQILFNRKSIGHINRNELFNLKMVEKDANINLSEQLQEKNRDLYINALGEAREKKGIDHTNFIYYFDRN
jgi:hypothetical protein